MDGFIYPGVHKLNSYFGCFNPTGGRAPLSTYFEADIFIKKSDYASAVEIIQKIKK